MWISRDRWQRTMDRVEKLEKQVRSLQNGPSAYFEGGEVHFWEGGHFSLAQALNAMAKHLGFRWEIQPEVQAVVEVQSFRGGEEKP